MDNGQAKPKKETRTATAILKPYYEDEWISVYVGDVRDVLPKLLASLAAKDRPQMCISSPPYLGLRDYGVDSQIGLEATPAEFTAAMVTVFDGCRSVLKDDGTLWLNLGDSYWGSGKGLNPDGTHSSHNKPTDKQFTNAGSLKTKRGSYPKDQGLKDKDLMLMPFKVARALRDAGWWLRQAFPWVKRSAMPGSQEDRATTALEWLFHLAKKKHYFYDAEAVRMGMAAASIARLTQDTTVQDGSVRAHAGAKTNGNMKAVGRISSQNSVASSQHSTRDRSLPTNRNGITGSLDETPSGSRGFRNTDLFYTQVDAPHGLIFAGDEIVGIDCNPAGFSGEYCTACKRYYHDAKDKREIEVSIQKSEASSKNPEGEEKQIRTCICGRADAWLSHFATFPTKLVTPFIRCGTSEAGECEKCGKAWVRVTDTEYHNTDSATGEAWSGNGQKAAAAPNSTAGKVVVKTGDGSWTYAERTRRIASTLGFEPQCECDAPARPQTVLDPFGGAGTTMIVAAKLGRKCISIELNEEYAAMSVERYKREMRKPVDPPRREVPPLFAIAEVGGSQKSA